MSRSRIILLAVMLAIAGALLPLGAMFYFSWVRAVEKEQRRLSLFANQAVARANLSFGQARNVLRAAQTFDGVPCSAEHIAFMRQLSFDTRSVEEMGYFENGLLKCTSWGTTQGGVPQSAADFSMPDGIQATVRMQPLVSRRNPMMALQYKAYNVLVDPARYVDVLVDPGIQISIASEGGMLLATLDRPDPALIKAIIANPRNGVDDTHLFATARGGGWIAVATERRGRLLENLRREQMLLLPIGLFIAAFMVGLVVWLSRRRLSPLGELGIAVQKREFVVHYQPIIELGTGACVGAEALVRWKRADGTLVRPEFFIPLAEESGLILKITDQVIGNVIRDMNRMLVADRALHIAINLAADDVRTARFLPVLENALEHTGIEAEQIWLEATERGFMDIHSARATIEQARARGHAIAIDDFGTGYSSLSYLQGLPMDALKIDKSFIDTIGTDSATSTVTPHIIDMAKSLNLKIVAEGIEKQAQLDYLLKHGVEYGQGWYFSRALPAEEFIAYYRRKLDAPRGFEPR